MDGLECSEIMLSHIPEWNPIFRIDAEFFNKKSINIDAYIRKMEYIHLHQDEVVSGPFGSTLKSESYLTSGYMPFVRIENIRGGFNVNTNNIVYISESDNARIKNSELQLNDIVLSKVGNSIGYFARVDEQLGRCNISENNIGIKLERYSTHFKHYLVTYLNSKYAQNLVKRRTSGNAQPKLNVGDMCYIPIPTFSEAIYKEISKIILRSEDNIVAAVSAYQAAEKQLSTIIDIPTDTTRCNTYSKLLSHTLSISGRLDAEYYQPKFDALFDTIKKFSNKRLGGNDGIVSIKKSIEPGSDAYKDQGIPFVRVSDVSKYEITPPEIYLSHDVVENVEALFPKKNTILFSKDGSVGIAYKLERDEDIITSGALLHLTVKNTSEVLPDYLTLVLNSPVVQMQAERDSNGAIIQHWKPSEIENVIVPVLDMDKQKELAEMVQKSFALRRQSKQLLEYAKRAVEIAIEQGEDAALAWLKDKVEQ